MADAATAERRLCAGSVRLLAGHTAKIGALAWAHEGGVLASASDDGTVRLWRGLTTTLSPGDLPLGGAGAPTPPTPTTSSRVYCSAVLRGHGAPVDALAWSPVAGERHALASVAGDGTLRLWDTREVPPAAGAFAAGSATAAISGMGTSGSRCEALLSLPGLAEAEHMAWRCDGGAIAVATRGDELILIDMRGGRPALLSRTRFAVQLNEVAWAPSGLLFSTCVQRSSTGALEEGHILVLRTDAATGAVTPVLQVLAHTMAANAIAFDRSFRVFATGGSDSLVALWDAADVTCLRTFDRNETIIRSVSFSAESTLVAAASDDKILEIVSARESELLLRASRLAATPESDYYVVARGRVVFSPSHDTLTHILLIPRPPSPDARN